MIVHFRGSVRKILITLILRWLGIRKFSLSEGIRTSAQHYFSSRVTANYFLHPFLTRLHAMMTEDPWVCTGGSYTDKNSLTYYYSKTITSSLKRTKKCFAYLQAFLCI